jgi:hypothetical protein
MVVALFVAFGAAACGDDDSGSSTTTSGSEQQAQSDTGAEARRDADGGGDGGRDAAEGDRPDSESSPASPQGSARDSGSGAEQFIVPGGDNSVQEFGAEAEPSELEEAAAALHAFLDARAEGDWDTACEHLSASVIESVEQFGSQSGRPRAGGCAQLLAAVSGPATKEAREEAAIADVGAMRVEGDRAFLLYHGAGGVDYAILMTREGDGWRVGAMAGVPIS